MVQVIHKDAADIGNLIKDEQTKIALEKMEGESIEQAASRLAAASGLPYIDLHLFPLDPENVMLIPEDEAHANGLTLFYKKDAAVRFALLDPKSPQTNEYITKKASDEGWQMEVYVTSRPSLEHAWHNYKKRTLIDNLDLVRVSLGGQDVERFEKNFGELIALKENHGVSTSRAMEIILAGAEKLRTSDIHIEAEESRVRLRYRIDGVLQDIGFLPKEMYQLLTSRIKMIGKMRINIRNEAQDGHFFIELDGKRIDVRVSSIPGKFGESINMRLLSSGDVIGEVDNIGLRGLAYEEVLRQIEKSSGMILNTGPTGSGKTTTLYTLLNRINKPGVKIITVEDPIEYSLPGIVQTEVSKDETYTFATALRAIVRQDPDVVLIGEIRDGETADIAVNAALTGHLVFSTLHTNSAPASIPRLIELGVKPSLIGSALNVLIGQRLVRKICDKCKVPYDLANETADSIIKLITIISPKAKVKLPTNVTTLWQAPGCVACHFTGFYGRIGIFEVLTLTPEITELINNMGTEEEIFKAALENGMVTMTQDGILKAIDGITTLDEVWRVADQTDILRSIYSQLMSNELSRASFISETLYNETQSHITTISAFGPYLLSINPQLRLPTVFAAAVALHAGDIHIEPQGENFTIRFRIDGILQTVAAFPLNEYPSFLGEIKVLGGLKTSERAGITDGRFSITLEKPLTAGSNKIDIRLSIILGGFGETVVLRLLNQSATKLDLATLGLRAQNLTKIIAATEKPNGLILNTGPTGSGKTTTLYGILARLNTPAVKIITVEDPIEYQMPGLLQTQVNEKEGYTFATALRSLLRQNPDVMMIGEIRDDETAQIAVQAASTGHLVLSTLHANSAAGTVSRLLKMGISGDDLANATSLIFSQRLVRKLCQVCKEQTAPTKEERAIIDTVLATLSKKAEVLVENSSVMWKAHGCKQCNGTGYNKQLILSETMPMDIEIQSLIARGALVSEIETQAVENGMITIMQDGILCVLEGQTTLDEVKRVTNL